MNRKKSKLRLIKAIFKLSIVLVVFFIVGILGIFAYYAKDLPSPSSIKEIRIYESTKIYDRTGNFLLYDIHGEQKRTIIPFEDIPEYVKAATIVAEDDNFYNHSGVDLAGVARALVKNLKGKTVLQGGSTITQQLIKNVYLTPERNYSRKIKELILSLELELKYSKDEILDFYLNIVPYGSNAYGVEAASQTFFNKHAKSLTLAESALLAALPKAPTYYSPFGNNPEQLTARQKYILERMYSIGYITQSHLNEALAENLSYSQELSNIKAPHFVMYVREQLEKIYGQDYLKSSGFSVITSLDWELQQEAEKIVKYWGDKNEGRFNAKNAALVAIDPKTGQILAMVGSRDYFDTENDGNVNVTTRLRQPGSSFKPFAYAKAFEKGYTPDTIIFDVETNFGVQGAEEYIPQNYTGEFRGPMTFKEALAQSINVASVKVLYLAGLSDTINLARSMGITSLNNDPSHYGLSLVLGGGEVTPLEETSAYGVFSQDGIYNKPIAILYIKSNNGGVLDEFKENPKKVMDPQIARLVTSILSDDSLRAPIFGSKGKLYLEGIPSAVKTGTTQGYRDAWTVGYTPNITVGVWVGNNDNSEMRDADGVKAAAPIWHDFMIKAHEIKNWDKTEFIAPEQIITKKSILNNNFGQAITLPIDIMSGKLATEFTPKELIEERQFYELHSLLYYVQKDNPRGEPPPNPESDPQFLRWEEGIKNWATQATSSDKIIALSFPPQGYDDIHTIENIPIITILYPRQKETISVGSPVQILLDIKNTFPVEKIEIFLDNEPLTTISNINIKDAEYSVFVQIPGYLSSLSSKENPHIIKIVGIDDKLNKGERSVDVVIE